MIPELNKVYNTFNDGKIKESRRYEVKIVKIIPFSEIDEETLEHWKHEVETCHWLYKHTTDYFIIADNGEEDEVYARTINDGWFGLGFLNSSRLDIDGSLYETIRNNDINNAFSGSTNSNTEIGANIAMEKLLALMNDNPSMRIANFRKLPEVIALRKELDF